MSAENIKCVLRADRHHGLTGGVRGVLETIFEAGADDFVLKRAWATALWPAVDAVLAGHGYGFPTAPKQT
jgi:hypothetical protein